MSTEHAQLVPDTEMKAPRLPELIVEDYRQACQTLGDKSYRKKLLELEIETIYAKIYALSKEEIEARKSLNPVEAPQ